ncbi:MAG: Ig-like domain-containing protein [Alistipes sp.]|nr:Ig-like domain-containing protein [Alistipes sp.]
MKKSILSLGLMLVALTLTNCTQNEEFDATPELGGGAFELYTDIDATRTANDGALGTDWVSGDALNVFHVEKDQTAYVSDGQFSIAEADVATGRFTGELGAALDAAKSYDWFAFYPYSKHITTPANTSAGYSYIGGRSDKAQTQTGNSNMEHIAGTNYPLYGSAKGVNGNSVPVLKMKHASALVEVRVTNGLTEPLTVTGVSLTTPETIQGGFYIDFSGETPQFADYTYVSTTASLSVANGEEIAVGASATFYFAIKPCEIAAGDSLDLSVSGYTASGNGEHAVSLDLTSEVLFEAGVIKTLNVTYTTPVEVVEPETWSLVSLVSEIKEGTYVILTKNADSGAISYLVNTTTSAAPLQATTSALDCTTATVSTNQVTDEMRWTFTGTAAAMKITNTEGSYLYATNTNNGMRVGTTEDTWAITTSKGNTAAFALKDSAQSRYLTAYQTGHWRCYTSEYGATSSQNSEIYLYYLGTIERTPVLSVENTAITDVHANGVEGATLPVTAANLTSEVAVTYDQTVVTSATYADGKVTYTVAANEGDAREGWIKLTSGTLEVTVTVSQNKVITAKTLPYTEPFATSIGSFDINNVNLGSLSSIWSQDSNYKCMVASGYGGAANNEAWLVSPTIDLTSATSPILSFDHAMGYTTGNDQEYCSVWIKEEGGEYVKVSIPEAYPTNFSFVTSGDISLKDYVGKKVVIGFKYVKLTDESTVAPKWEIQNFAVEDRKFNQSISFTSGSLDAVMGEAVTGLTVEGAKTSVTYTSSNESVATVDSATGAITLVGVGNTTITATAAESDEYASATAEYTLVVAEAGTSSTTVTLNLSEYLSGNVADTTKQCGDFTLSFKKVNSNTSNWNSGGHLRLYKSDIMTIDGGSKVISKIVIETTSSSYTGGFTCDSGSGSYSGNTYTWIGSASSVALTAAGSQARFSSIDITYTE